MANDTSIIKTVWNGNATGKGNIKGSFLNTDIAIPKALGGNGEGTDPKELLISSAVACVTMTLSGMLQAQKLPAKNIAVDTESSQNESKNIVMTHHVHVTLEENAKDDEVAATEKAISAADRRCAIGNILKEAGVEITTKGSVSIES